MTTISELAQVLQDLLTAEADRIARETGFVQRESKLGGAEFSQTLVFGWQANPEATLSELAQTAATLGVTITAQGLNDRFTAPAAACLRELLETAVGMVVSAQPPMAPILQRFNGVYIQDSTTITLPEVLADLWLGCGNASGTGQAALKVQVQFDYCSGALNQVILQAGRAQDRNAPVQRAALPAGALRLADLGYFNLSVLATLSQQDVYWLTRLQAGTALYRPSGERLDLLALLHPQDIVTVDQEILVGSEQRLPCRLLAVRVPQEVADQRRRELRTEARHKGQTVSQTRLALAEWTLFITNAPRDKLTLREALTVARCRWQIELLFKLWKSHGHVDTSRSDHPWRVLCEVYAKLLAMVVQHWLFLVCCWTYPDRSLFKAAQTVRSHALHLAAHFGCGAQLVEAITVIQRCLAVGCRINKSRASPHTYQLLAALDTDLDGPRINMTDSNKSPIAQLDTYGGDKPLSYLDLGREDNPFLGWRAIRVCLDKPDFFKIQLRALWRASPGHDLRIMFPMIATVDEVHRARSLLDEAHREVTAGGYPVAARIQTGIMVEIPSAAVLADRFVPVVDFFSIGTNDLTQYTLAAERTNQKVAHLGDPCHPAVLRQIRNVIAAAHRGGIWVGVCGEMAGDPEAAPILLGLGLDEFSMAPGSIPRVKVILRGWAFVDAAQLAAQAVDLDSAEEVRALVRSWAGGRTAWP